MYSSDLSIQVTSHSCNNCGQHIEAVVSYAGNRRRKDDVDDGRETSAVSHLKQNLRRFIEKYGSDASLLLQRARELWHGSAAERVMLIDESQRSMGLLEAWELVDMAGQEGAKYLPLLARRVVLGSCIDLRA